jgi:hypothetical protein
VAAGFILTRVLKGLSNAGWEATNAVAKYNGSLLGAQKALEVSRMLREVGMASALQESGTDHLQAQNRLERAMHPWLVMFEKMKSKIGAAVTNFGASVIENPFAAMADAVPDFLVEGLGMDNNQFVKYWENYGASIADNPLGYMFGLTPPGMAMNAMGMEEQNVYLKEISDLIKGWLGIVDVEPQAVIDPLALHNGLINQGFQPMAPLPGLGAAPPNVP